MKKAYYARPINLYGTLAEERDKSMIEKAGFEPIDINKDEIQDIYEVQGMEVFKSHVVTADCLFFRAMADGRIGAGVFKEIEWAMASGIPVFEIPTRIKKRAASVEETREYLSDCGHR